MIGRKRWVVLVLCVSLVGCPFLNPPAEFRSADITQGGGPIAYATDGPPGGQEDAGEPIAAPREVVEPDIYRQSGDLLFALNQYRGLAIIDMPSQKLIGSLPVGGFPRDIYIAGNKAYVLTANAVNYRIDGTRVEFDISSRLVVADISDPASPQIIGEATLNGDLMDSRLVGDVLYAVTGSFTYVVVNSAVKKQQTSSTFITSFNVQDASNIQPVDRLEFPGIGHVVQATNTAIYVGSYAYTNDGTTLTYVDIADPGGLLAIRGTANVPGSVEDRFKIDAYNGVLRVVSNARLESRETFVTTFDLANPDTLDQLGQTRLETASGDTLFGVRFVGDLAYIVTYFRVDPFYVVDLSDPSAPSVVGELEVPGWSVHLEPISDTTILALGIDDTDGRRVSLSLFDVSDPANPSLKDRVSIGENWSYSEALWDVRAFSVMNGVAAVPVNGYDNESQRYYSRVQFVNYDESALGLGGFVDVPGGVSRTIDTGDTYFALGALRVAVIDRNTANPALINSIALADNVADVIPLSGGGRIEVVDDYSSDLVELRRFDAANVQIGALNVEIGGYLTGFAAEGGAVLVGYVYNEDGHARAAKVNLTDSGMALGPVADLPIAPNAWFYYGPHILEDFKTVAPGGASIWGDLSQQEFAFLLSGKLVIPGWQIQPNNQSGYLYDNRALAVIDLSDFSVNMRAIGSDMIEIFQGGDSLYIVNKETQEAPGDLLPYCAFYVRRYDVETGTSGPRANVPGLPIGYDPVSDVLTVQDFQWPSFAEGFWEPPNLFLRTVEWDDTTDAASIITTLQLPENAQLPSQFGDVVYSLAYDELNLLYATAWVVGDDGSLLSEGDVLVTSQWGRLIGADGLKAYMSIGTHGVARYAFDGTPRLDFFEATAGHPSHVRIGGTQAYTILGYGGVHTTAR